MVNIHHCVFDKLLVCALGLSQIFDHLLVDVCVYVKQKKLGSCKSIIPHHRNRLYYRAVAVVGLNLKGIEYDYSVTILNRGNCCGFGLVFISNREK
jgi:hypothetical protein